MTERDEEVNVVAEDEQQSQAKPKQRKRRRKRMLTGISKQRRLANERERRRLQVVNTAFVSLKNVLPLASVDQKISRIEIVRLASKHIASLMRLLHPHDDDDLQGIEEPGNFCTEEAIIPTSDDETLSGVTHEDSDEGDEPSDDISL